MTFIRYNLNIKYEPISPPPSAVTIRPCDLYKPISFISKSRNMNIPPNFYTFHEQKHVKCDAL
jgi:hypothetical protein